MRARAKKADVVCAIVVNDSGVYLPVRDLAGGFVQDFFADTLNSRRRPPRRRRSGK